MMMIFITVVDLLLMTNPLRPNTMEKNLSMPCQVFKDQFCVLEIASFHGWNSAKLGESNAIFTAMIQLSTKH